VETLFWACVLLGVYPYLLYPMLAWVAARLVARSVDRGDIKPRVSVLISAYNEAAHIEATVRNKLEQDYKGELEVWVASDSSSDGTDHIVASVAATDPRVRLVRQEDRQGKTAALNRLIGLATGEIIIFSDANSLYRLDAVRKLVENFGDQSVGYVTGKMVYVSAGSSLVGDGCTAYMRYENWLRSVETELGSIVGVDGGVDAVRRRLYRCMRVDQLPDFVLPLAVVQQGLRVIYDPRAVLQEGSLNDESAEFRMRVRVSLRALWALRDERALLCGSAGALFAWQLWSHKLLRYVSFLPLVVACVVNIYLATVARQYQALLIVQACFWGLVLLGSLGIRWTPARLCFYFLLLNAASTLALTKFVRGERIVTWQPRLG
jgi:cellulose synthase/poly-beta-1,6-N-acetylglucosamine synthase-like glycosyltransferase